MEKVRIDKWLWSVRLFKTRTLASDECNKGHVSIDGVKVKPSREIKVGEEIHLRKAPVEYVYVVKQLTDKRMGAKLVPEFMDDITPQEQLDLLNASKSYMFEFRERGTGRPTKRDRRLIDQLKEGNDFDI